MNELKAIVFSAIFTISVVAFTRADEPGKKGFSMDYSVIGSMPDGVDFNDGRSVALRMADFSAAAAGVLRFGYDLGDMRADLEIGVRTLDEENLSGATQGEGEINIFSALINGAMDFDPIAGAIPYAAFGFGASLGIGDITYTDGDGNAGRARFADIAPIGHIGFGARMTLSGDAGLTLGYSFLAGPPGAGGQGALTPTHSLSLGFEYRF